jgi:pimeloyl-ACP methyl ester carboxylesterase
VISKRMSDSRRVIAVDQRNHGDSPWFDTHSYLDMAQDLAQVVEHNGAPMDIVGHSMGGKAVMILALTRPDLVKRLLVADIAPVAYGHDQSQYIQAMQSIDLTHMEKRSEVAQALSKHVTDPALQSFFTQSLDLGNKRWKLNLDVLQRDMHHVLGFPEVTGSFDKPTLFLSGANSQYVLPDHRPKIKALFPNAVFAKIPNAGHWLHAEQPRAFEQTLRVFFNDPA